MNVKSLRKFLDLIDNEEAEIYITDFENWTTDDSPILGRATPLLDTANRKYIHPETHLIAARPCIETSGSREALILYVKKTSI